MNFTKTNTATIRYTNSQWPREDATEALVGKVAVKNPVVNPTLIPSTVPISFPSARDPATEVLVGRVAVPKTGQKNALPRRDAPEVPVGRVVVPKTGQKPPFATQGCLWSTCGQGGRAEQIVRRIIMIEVKVLVGYAPWQMVSGGIGSRKGKGPTKWEGPPGTICHGAIMDQLFIRRRHWLPKRRGPRSGKALPAPSVTKQS